LKENCLCRARFAADGRGVWFSADLGEEFLQLRYLDLAETKPRTLTGDLPWDIDDFEVDPSGRYVAYVANVDGYSRLELKDLGSNITKRPNGLPAGLISNLRFDARGTQLGLTIESATSPRDAWSYDIEKETASRWTRSESGPVDTQRWQAAELVRYPTWDRVGKQPRQIPAFVYTPSSSGPHPVVIDIHGGPEGQSRPGYSPYIQYLVNELGYAVIQPNVRGSTGYGRTFTQLDNGRLREADSLGLGCVGRGDGNSSVVRKDSDSHVLRDGRSRLHIHSLPAVVQVHGRAEFERCGTRIRAESNTSKVRSRDCHVGVSY